MGEDARDWVQATFEGRPVHLRAVGVNIYGCFLGHLQLADGTSVNQEIFRQGYARPFGGAPAEPSRLARTDSPQPAAPSSPPVVCALLEESRVLCIVLHAFPEALETLKTYCPELKVTATTVLCENVRALSPKSGIFESEEEIRFAQDMLLQIGRELTPENPLGWGDLGALVAQHNTAPNNTLPIFWSLGSIGSRSWRPLFPRN